MNFAYNSEMATVSKKYQYVLKRCLKEKDKCWL